MKKITALLSLILLACGTLFAQGILVRTGNITYAYPYDESTTMTYTANQLTINGHAFDLAQITSIDGTTDVIATQSVSVNWQGAAANVIISGDMADRVSASLEGANVTLTDVADKDDSADFPEVTYHLSGTSTDGSFTQNGSFKCTLSLEGLSLESKACPFQVSNGKRIAIVVADGTQNTFKDGTNNVRKSAFWIKGHAEFSGAGTLNITGTQRHAYSSNEYTLLKNSFTGTINILGSAGDGMHIDQYFEQRNGNIVFTKDAIAGDNIDVAQTTDDLGNVVTTDLNNGQVIISGGTLTCHANTADTKCIKSETTMSITGGYLQLNCTGAGSRGLQVGTNLLIEQDVAESANVRPYIYIYATGGTYKNPADSSDTSKCRGIKVKKNFVFNGGTIERDATSTVTATKIIDVDGIYTYQAGAFKNCSYSQI